MTRAELEDLTRKLAAQLADEGKLIAAGFQGFRLATVHPEASADQVENLRWAFMAGAGHLFSSIMNFLDPGEEGTEQDMRRIELIGAELEAFGKEIEAITAREMTTQGNA